MFRKDGYYSTMYGIDVFSWKNLRFGILLQEIVSVKEFFTNLQKISCLLDKLAKDIVEDSGHRNHVICKSMWYTKAIMVEMSIRRRLESGIFFPVLLTLIFFMSATIAKAQDAGPDYPTYLVEDGDSLWAIAQRFGVSVDELAKANDLSDSSQLRVGDELKIPGLLGIQGKLVTIRVPFGEDLHSFNRRTLIGEEVLARLNRMTTPRELPVGSNLILVEQGMQTSNGNDGNDVHPILMRRGITLLEMAVEQQVNPWDITRASRISHSWQAIPGSILLTKTGVVEGAGALPFPISSAELIPAPTGQGKTVTLRVKTHIQPEQPLSLSGRIAGNSFNFFSVDDSQGKVFIALQGLDNMMIPGYYPVDLNVDLGNGESFAFNQAVYVRDSGYLYEKFQITDEELMDPAKTQPEEDQLASLTAAASPEKMWSGFFQSPVDKEYTDCWPSTFGRRRSLNGSAYTYIHNGLDFCGQVGHPIYAPAKGKVVFAGELFVRGNTTVIDHGWGVYTVYAHQSEIKVKVGDMVEPGQTIGAVGETGRVTGPHLHWEVWVGNIRVDPYDWLLGEYPAPE